MENPRSVADTRDLQQKIFLSMGYPRGLSQMLLVLDLVPTHPALVQLPLPV